MRPPRQAAVRAVQALVQERAGKLQVVEAEHRQREQHEHRANAPSTQAFCSAAASSAPDNAAATPAAA